MRIAAACLLLLLAAGCAATPSPYAGQEARGLKALSPDELAAYVEGRGQGFAKPAELNGYPGPMHVLELADRLRLTPQQREATQNLLERHRAEARKLGSEYIDSERALERLFAHRAASPQAVAAAITRSAEIHGRIRASHLLTHLEQTKLLEPSQAREYHRLRGYADGTARTEHRGQHH